MKDFFKPAKVTWLVLAFPFAFLLVSLTLAIEGGAGVLFMLFVQWPFVILKGAGLPVGRLGDYVGYAFPNGFGWILLLLIDLLIWYSLARLISKVYYYIRDARGGMPRVPGR